MIIKEAILMVTVHYPNLRAFMKRHRLTVGDLAKIIDKSYPPAYQKINRKETKRGKAAMFDIEEARAILTFVKKTEENYLKSKYGDDWQKEWIARWGHISDWFEYIFFDEVVTNVTSCNAMF
jgi:hypothetical protein